MRSPTAAAATSVRSDGTAASARQDGSPDDGGAVVAVAGAGGGASGSPPVQAASSSAATAAIRSLPMARYANGVRAGTPEEAVPMSIATSEQAVVDAVTPRLFIGGEWREAGGGSFAVEDPSTGEELC